VSREIMPVATLTSKGQITIPVEVRHSMKLDTGDRLEFIQIEPGRYELVAAKSNIRELKGMFGIPAKAVSLAEMNAAISSRGASAK
jgi:AbrB family looped-hinge helix DNA binding protein